MFSASTYVRRRRRLYEADAPQRGLVLLLGNEQSPMNYADNPYPFRQDSTFLYYVGLDVPGLAAVLDLDTGSTCLYGDDPTLDDAIWMGNQTSRTDLAEASGLSVTDDRSALASNLTDALDANRPVHFLPPYRPGQQVQLSSLLGLQPDRVASYASLPLQKTVVRHRSQKTPEEVDQLELALDTTVRMHRSVFQNATPGTTERALAGALAGRARAEGNGLSFRPTCSIHGEVLHNHEYQNTLQANDLLLVDAGAASPLHYAGDITRVTPVGGSFTSRQRDIYNAVLDAQDAAISALQPGRPFREIHLLAAEVLTEHLIELGLMQGTAADAVRAGAHALFFPHGLGHMLGLDTHDMENLGEDLVGYAPDQDRSSQFGLHTLRLARPLQSGFVVTIEPGCYFIPALINRWQAENRHAEFINYDVVNDFVGMGGVRIEDDLLITADAARVLGPDLPKTAEAVEAAVATG